MASAAEKPTRVNPRPYYVRGQSVKVVATEAVGVVVDVLINPIRYVVAVWPSRQLLLGADELAPLTYDDACLRSIGVSGSIREIVDAVAEHVGDERRRVCRPRPRDGRCHWCDSQIDGGAS